MPFFTLLMLVFSSLFLSSDSSGSDSSGSDSDSESDVLSDGDSKRPGVTKQPAPSKPAPGASRSRTQTPPEAVPAIQAPPKATKPGSADSLIQLAPGPPPKANALAPTPSASKSNVAVKLPPSQPVVMKEVKVDNLHAWGSLASTSSHGLRPASPGAERTASSPPGDSTFADFKKKAIEMQQKVCSVSVHLAFCLRVGFACGSVLLVCCLFIPFGWGVCRSNRLVSARSKSRGRQSCESSKKYSAKSMSGWLVHGCESFVLMCCNVVRVPLGQKPQRLAGCISTSFFSNIHDSLLLICPAENSNIHSQSTASV